MYRMRSSDRVISYFGGPVLSSMRVIPLFWNSATKYQTEVVNFYRALSGSSYWSILSQYNSIGNPTVAPSVMFAKNETVVTDSQIQLWLRSLFDSGTLAAPTNGQNYYPIHFPAGVSVRCCLNNNRMFGDVFIDSMCCLS
jgi:hypothetical protein